jgi:hypothetical protein
MGREIGDVFLWRSNAVSSNVAFLLKNGVDMKKSMAIFVCIFGCLTLTISIASDASDKPADGGAAESNAPVAQLSIATEIPYMDESLIPGKILKECVSLGKTFSQSAETFGRKYGVQVDRKEHLTADSERDVLVLKMVTAVSAGNAFMGHHKSMTAKGELYRDGKLVRTVTKERSSRGGFGAGFKGSCTVLERTVETLGSDFIKWVIGSGAHDPS